jgi:hypothetical protein
MIPQPEWAAGRATEFVRGFASTAPVARPIARIDSGAPAAPSARSAEIVRMPSPTISPGGKTLEEPFPGRAIVTGHGTPIEGGPLRPQSWWDRYAGYENLIQVKPGGGGYDTRVADAAISGAMRLAERQANPIRTDIRAPTIEPVTGKIIEAGFPRYYGGGGTKEVKVGGISEEEAALFKSGYIRPTSEQMLTAGVPLARVREEIIRPLALFEREYDPAVAKYASAVILPSASQRAHPRRRKHQRVSTKHLVHTKEHAHKSVKAITPAWTEPHVEHVHVHGVRVGDVNVPHVHSMIHAGLAQRHGRAKAQEVHMQHVVPDKKIRKKLASMSVDEATGHHVHAKKRAVDVSRVGVTRGNLKLDILGGFETKKLPKVEIEGFTKKKKK